MTTGHELPRINASLSLKEKAYAAIKEAILKLELEPGAPLVESELARQLGISKTPVRDALQELEREGFVTRIPFKGTYVTEISVKDLIEIFQLRAVLEGLAANLAAERFTEEDLAQLTEVLDAAEEALAEGDLHRSSASNRMLHEAIVDKADNERLRLLVHNLDDHVKRFGAVSDRIRGRLDTSIREHRVILEALCKQDSMAAEEAVREHFNSVLKSLVTSEFH